MAYDPNIRASDADRDRTATQLREHLAAGLDADEFNERLDKAFSAKTVGELDALLADLPSIDLYRLPDSQLTRQPQQQPPALRRQHSGNGWRAAWGSWFTVVLLTFVIWALSGAGYPWPLWVALPWGVVMLGSWISTGAFGHDHGRGELGERRDRNRRQLPGGDEDLPGRPGQ